MKSEKRELPWAKKFVEGLFKDPKGRLEMDIINFAVAVLSLRTKHLFSVTSWGRTDARNKLMKGVEGSYHLMWLGIDAVLEPMVKSLEFERDAGKVGLLAIFEGNHYHLQPK